MPNRFCAICGKTLDKNAPQYNMCLSCYVKENPLFELPSSFTFKKCVECNAFTEKEKWITPSDYDLLTITTEALKRYLLKQYVKRDEIEFKYSILENNMRFSSRNLVKAFDMLVKGNLKTDRNISHEITLRIIIQNDICKNCSNLVAGGHYLSIMQLRVKDESQFEILEEALIEIHKYVEKVNQGDSKQYISKIEDQKYGIDLYLSTNELMNHLISFLKNQYHFLLTRSKKLVGRNIQRGRNIYRLKSSIKFIPFKKNELLIIEGEEYFVEAFSKNRVILKNKEGSKLTKSYEYFFK